MTTGSNDLDTLSAAELPTDLTLESGFKIKVERLRTRATLSLLKILTRGLGEFVTTLRFDADDEEALAQQLVTAVLFSIPEAEEETIEFIKRMVSPADLIGGRTLSKGEIQYNQDLALQLDAQLDDPELEDLITVVTAIVELEAPHLVALGKRLSALLPKASRLSTTPTPSNEPLQPSDSSNSDSEISIPAAS